MINSQNKLPKRLLDSLPFGSSDHFSRKIPDGAKLRQWHPCRARSRGCGSLWHV